MYDLKRGAIGAGIGSMVEFQLLNQQCMIWNKRDGHRQCGWSYVSVAEPAMYDLKPSCPPVAWMSLVFQLLNQQCMIWNSKRWPTPMHSEFQLLNQQCMIWNKKGYSPNFEVEVFQLLNQQCMIWNEFRIWFPGLTESFSCWTSNVWFETGNAGFDDFDVHVSVAEPAMYDLKHMF